MTLFLLLFLFLVPGPWSPVPVQDRAWADALQTWQKFSGSKEALERRRAALDLGDATDEKHDKVCAQLLGGLLRSELAREGMNGRTEEKVSGEVLEACVASLRRITSKDVLSDLQKSAKLKTEHPRWRAYAIWAIAPRLELRELAELAQDRSPLVQVAAADGLAERADASVVPTLIRLLSENHCWELKVAALRGLGAAGDESAVEAGLEGLARCTPDEGLLKEHYVRLLQKLLRSDLASDDPNAWKSLVIARRNGSDSAPGMTVTEPVEFYGLKTRSTRLVFVLDRTGSMTEPALEPERPPFKLPPELQPAEKEPVAERQAREEVLRLQKKWAAITPKTRMEVAKKEFVHTICLLSPRVHFNVIWFESVPAPWRQELAPATWAQKLDCLREAEKIAPAGTTDLWDALELAFRMVEPPGSRLPAIDRKANYATITGGVDTLYLLSDGRPNSGRLDKIDDILSELRKLRRLRRVAIHTVCLGTAPAGSAATADAPDPVFLKRIADENGGEFRHLQK